jgi:hypothetical protein
MDVIFVYAQAVYDDVIIAGLHNELVFDDFAR